MKTAQALFDYFIQAIRLPKGHSIVLTEIEPRGERNQNWTIAIGNAPDDVNTRFSKALKDMSKQDPIIDWSAVQERNGGRRHIAAGKAV